MHTVVWFSLLTSASDHVLTFGWNEHGMCGTGDEVNVPMPLIVEALQGWRPVLLGSGAGHCFVVAHCKTNTQ